MLPNNRLNFQLAGDNTDEKGEAYSEFAHNQLDGIGGLFR
jgi:hypothetical protein